MSTTSIAVPQTTPRGLPTTESRLIALTDALGVPSDWQIVDADTYEATPASRRQTLTGRGGRMVHVIWQPLDDPETVRLALDIPATQALATVPSWDDLIGAGPVTARTPAEIVARIEGIATDDIFGFRREVLIEALPYENAISYLKPDTTPEQWHPFPNIEAAAEDYLRFAIGKIEGHRGISASRSVDKLSEFAWLLGRDDVCTAMDGAGYAQYGAPKVKAFAEGMGMTGTWLVQAGPDVLRMAEGDPCETGCETGCAR